MEEIEYLEILQDHKKLVREIDVIINGKYAAKQASLCDLVGQIKELVCCRDELNKINIVNNKSSDFDESDFRPDVIYEC